jgi:hypothetical protein
MESSDIFIKRTFSNDELDEHSQHSFFSETNSDDSSSSGGSSPPQTPDNELMPDPTPILTLPPDEPEEILNDEEKELLYKRNKALKCKTIALDYLNLHPIKTNVSNLSQTNKKKVLKVVEEYFDKEDEEINELFNKICIETVFNSDMDYSEYPIYNRKIHKNIQSVRFDN